MNGKNVVCWHGLVIKYEIKVKNNQMPNIIAIHDFLIHSFEKINKVFITNHQFVDPYYKKNSQVKAVG